MKNEITKLEKIHETLTAQLGDTMKNEITKLEKIHETLTAQLNAEGSTENKERFSAICTARVNVTAAIQNLKTAIECEPQDLDIFEQFVK